MRKTALALTLAASLIAPAALAGSGSAGAGLRAACGEDIKKLCPEVQPGGGRILQCLAGQKDKVTEGCRAALKDMAATAKERQGQGGTR